MLVALIQRWPAGFYAHKTMGSTKEFLRLIITNIVTNDARIWNKYVCIGKKAHGI
jgi:hypothetical protein